MLSYSSDHWCYSSTSLTNTNLLSALFIHQFNQLLFVSHHVCIFVYPYIIINNTLWVNAFNFAVNDSNKQPELERSATSFQFFFFYIFVDLTGKGSWLWQGYKLNITGVKFELGVSYAGYICSHVKVLLPKFSDAVETLYIIIFSHLKGDNC